MMSLEYDDKTIVCCMMINDSRRLISDTTFHAQRVFIEL